MFLKPANSETENGIKIIQKCHLKKKLCTAKAQSEKRKVPEKHGHSVVT